MRGRFPQTAARVRKFLFRDGVFRNALYRNMLFGFLMISLALATSCDLRIGADQIVTPIPTPVPTAIVTETPTPSPLPEPTATPIPLPVTPTPEASSGLPVIKGLDTSWIPPEGLAVPEGWTGMTAYLTFDDGPSPKKTIKILSVLNSFGVKATFFVEGRYIDNETAPAMKMIAENGHAIGNHTTSHLASYQSFDYFQTDVDATSKRIKDVTGITTHLFRYPGGSNTSMVNKIFPDTFRFLKERGLVYFDWNTSCGDGNASPYTAVQLRDNVMQYVDKQKTLVVLMHDSGSPDTGHDQIGALPLIIHSLYNRGYRFSKILPETPPVQFRKS